MKEFSERLRESRRAARLTQGELADRVKCSRDSITRWERGGDMPSARMVVLLAQVLEIPVTYLVGLKPTPHFYLTSDAIRQIAHICSQLSDTGQQVMLEAAKEMLKAERMWRMPKKGKSGGNAPARRLASCG